MGVFLQQKFTSLSQLLEKAAHVRAGAELEERLNRWSEPPSKTEQEKCERAERMVREAIDEDPKLSQMKIRVFAKGSFANRTNVPSDSDVDIGVLHEGQFFNTYPEGTSQSDFNFVTSNYSFKEFATDVAVAIENKFGKSEITADDKCIKIRSNSCRVDADVVPHYAHRRYTSKESHYEGVAISTPAKMIYNWPKQDYDNGVSKNTATFKKYKGLVRILKSIRSEMTDEGLASADAAKSYLLACLAWNIPDSYFIEDEYKTVLFNSLDYLISMTADLVNVKEWVEVNHMKYLFRASQPWKLEDIHQFLKDAKEYMEQYR